MKCPHCKNELTTVRVYSEALQIVEVNGDGECGRYGEAILTDAITAIECPNCDGDIAKLLHHKGELI